MPSMIELIRASAVPSNIIQAAAKGTLSMPPKEMVEILVFLANQKDAFSEQARLTFATFDEKYCLAAASHAHTPEEVLDYMIAPENFRAVLLPPLIENLVIPEESLAPLAAAVPREAVDVFLSSARVNRSLIILNALATNPNLSGIQTETIKSRITPLEPIPVEEVPAAGDDVLDHELTAYLNEHAHEISTENEKPFQPIGGIHEEILSSEEPLSEAAAASGEARTHSTVANKASVGDEGRGSALQKISRLDVKGRIQLAMKGSKEDRSILVRDGTKVVALAVLESPKVTDGEVEMFAGQKNVLESLLRGIPMKRRFMKRYPIVRNLASNPRTPLDVSLGLMKNLLVNDLKNLSDNKDVPDTVRKLAIKMYKQKKDSGKK